MHALSIDLPILSYCIYWCYEEHIICKSKHTGKATQGNCIGFKPCGNHWFPVSSYSFQCLRAKWNKRMLDFHYWGKNSKVLRFPCEWVYFLHFKCVYAYPNAYIHSLAMIDRSQALIWLSLANVVAQETLNSLNRIMETSQILSLSILTNIHHRAHIKPRKVVALTPSHELPNNPTIANLAIVFRPSPQLLAKRAI